MERDGGAREGQWQGELSSYKIEPYPRPYPRMECDSSVPMSHLLRLEWTPTIGAAPRLVCLVSGHWSPCMGYRCRSDHFRSYVAPGADIGASKSGLSIVASLHAPSLLEEGKQLMTSLEDQGGVVA